VPTPVEAFLLAIDQAWVGTPVPRIRLRVIGSTALMLHLPHLNWDNWDQGQTGVKRFAVTTLEIMPMRGIFLR
jgi:hypothetical protein